MPNTSPTTDAIQAQRLLIIDDDRKLCRLITDYLSPLGYEVTAARRPRRRGGGDCPAVAGGDSRFDAARHGRL
ncbi:MAG: hypothetical protein R3F19_23095 [Verrucomicrobiales bacterium]